MPERGAFFEADSKEATEQLTEVLLEVVAQSVGGREEGSKALRELQRDLNDGRPERTALIEFWPWSLWAKINQRAEMGDQRALEMAQAVLGRLGIDMPIPEVGDLVIQRVDEMLDAMEKGRVVIQTEKVSRINEALMSSN